MFFYQDIVFLRREDLGRIKYIQRQQIHCAPREIQYVVILLLEHPRKIISVEMSIFTKFKLPKLSGVNGKSDSEVDKHPTL